MNRARAGHSVEPAQYSEQIIGQLMAAVPPGSPLTTGSRWQASTQEVRDWAASAGFETGADGSIPEQAIAAYNETHPDRPY